jgi:hypothetical protein
VAEASAANLLHHAVEMALKGALAKKGMDLKALKCLSHDLPRVWREFTAHSSRRRALKLWSRVRVKKGFSPAAGRKNRIMIYGPKPDGTYVIEFKRRPARRSQSQLPPEKRGVIRHFQERMPCGLSVPDTP